MMTYYNLITWDVIVWISPPISGGFAIGATLAVQHFGEPSGKFVCAIFAVYDGYGIVFAHVDEMAILN